MRVGGLVAAVLAALPCVACELVLPAPSAPVERFRLFAVNESRSSRQVWLVDHRWQWAEDVAPGDRVLLWEGPPPEGFDGEVIVGAGGCSSGPRVRVESRGDQVIRIAQGGEISVDASPPASGYRTPTALGVAC